MINNVIFGFFLLFFVCACQSKPEPDKGAGVQDVPNHHLAAKSIDKFLTSIKSLEQIGFYRSKMDCENTLDSGYCCLLNSNGNWLAKSIRENNEGGRDDGNTIKVNIKPINLDSLVTSKKCFVVANYEVQKDMYPRTAIYEWTFSSSTYAELVGQQLKNLNETEWFFISKTPITWWIDKNRIYFIVPSGFFVLSEVPKIENQMKKILK